MSILSTLEQRSSKSADKVIFLPDWSQSNPYQNLLKTSLEEHQFEVEFIDFPKGFFSLAKLIRKRPSVIVLHIHWVNGLINHIFWSPSRFIQRVKIFLLVLDILYVRLRGTKVVWTIHNLVSHETPNKNLEIEVRKIIARACSHVIIHSKSAFATVEQTYGINLKAKGSVIHHGNYDGCYVSDEKKALEFKNTWRIGDDSIVILFFGGIRPYKGIRKLINTFVAVSNPILRLIIAGNSQDAELLEFIENCARHDARIIPLLKFIPEDDVSALFSITDIVAVPFERTLTSGSVILALTMGKALLLPEEARVFDLVNEDCCIFFDSVSSMQSSILSLDKLQLSQMGKVSRQIADELDWSGVAKQVAAIYR